MKLYTGLGATYEIGTDAHPMTICEVGDAGLRLGVRFDKVRGPGVFELADTSLPAERWFRLHGDGHYQLDGRPFGRLLVGTRRWYYDPDVGTLR